jgi:integrase
MATIKAVVRKPRSDGFYPVYIRVTQNQKSSFFQTGKVVDKNGLTSKGEIKDPYVLEYTSRCIREYYEKLNMVDSSIWTVGQVVEYIQSKDEGLSFSEYARRHYTKLLLDGKESNSSNEKQALVSLERFMGTDNILFGHLTHIVLTRWIASLSHTKRAKTLYPMCLRKIFKDAVFEHNDYDNGIIKIKNEPWTRIRIQEPEAGEKRAITPEMCRKFFSAPVKSGFQEVGRDVAMMILCLAGINVADLLGMRKSDYKNGILCYNRRKTRSRRKDKAYIEMRVPDILKPIIEKYRDRSKSQYLFVWGGKYTNINSFTVCVSRGIQTLCEDMGLNERYTSYTFRHTWGTVAQNDIKASISDVAFAMNHTNGFNVTRGYIKMDFTPAWELNEKVVDFIFFTDKPSARETKKEIVKEDMSPGDMIQASAYHMGRKVAELTNIGFRNNEEVIGSLVAVLPDDVPEGSIVIFKVVNMDKDQTAVYQKQKGKGF